MAAIPRLQFKADRVQWGDHTLHEVSGFLDNDAARLRVGRLIPGGEPGLYLADLVIDCETPGGAPETACSGADWSLKLSSATSGWTLPISGSTGSWLQTVGGWSIQSHISSGQREGNLSLSLHPGGGEAELRWSEQSIAGMMSVPFLPPEIQWVRQGGTTGRLVFDWPETGSARLRYEVELSDVGFDSPEGRFAGEGLNLWLGGTVELAETPHAQVELTIHSGDLLLDNLYTAFSDSAFQAHAQLQKLDNLLVLSDIRVSDGGALELEANATIDLDRPLDSLDYQLHHLEMHFPESYTRYIESMAGAWTLDGLTVTGSLLWTGDSGTSLPGGGVLDVLDLTIVDGKRGRFAVTGLDAHISRSGDSTENFRPGGGPGSGSMDSRFSWRGLLVRRINFGGSEAAVIATPGQFTLASPLELDVLGGRLVLDDLQVNMPGSSTDAKADGEPEIRLFATLENLDMLQLTRALDWPQFGGTVSGKIPGVTLDDGVLAVEGQIEFNVFSGQLLLSGLRVERPFGVLPSLAANLEVDDLDLQQLTQTFSFGRIAGRMSGFVHDLRMLDWKPVAFDAWFGTPLQQSGSNEISRQAVNRLTTIGGGNATVALTGPVLKLFNNFSYKRLGLGCRLSNNVCEVRGLDDDDASVLIMEGAGVPKVMIRAFNRQMDWPTLVAGLTAASQGESIRVGDKK